MGNKTAILESADILRQIASILAITTHRMPNILTSFIHTKRHLNYLKLYSHCPEYSADSADVFYIVNIAPHPPYFYA